MCFLKFTSSLLIQLLLVTTWTQIVKSAHRGDWGYGPGYNGPLNWCNLNVPGAENCCGLKQSPINIDNALSCQYPYKLTLINYDLELAMTAFNVHHSALANLTNRVINPPGVTGGPLGNEKYVFEDIHFHWGKAEDRGSEHTIYQQRFPLEMHVVHSHEKYRHESHSYKEAKKQKEGLAIIAVMFTVRNNDNPKLNELLRAMTKARCDTQSAHLRYTLRLDDLVPVVFNEYFTYKGSLTKPPCSESATWIVLTKKVPISIRQLEMLRSLRTNNDETAGCRHQLADNFRPTQLLNDRCIYRIATGVHRDCDKLPTDSKSCRNLGLGGRTPNRLLHLNHFYLLFK